MDHIITGTGRHINVVHCGSLNYILYITIDNMGFVESAQIFSDTDETGHIEHYDTDGVIVGTFDGYTKLTDIMDNGQNQIRITLIKSV